MPQPMGALPASRRRAGGGDFTFGSGDSPYQQAAARATDAAAAGAREQVGEDVGTLYGNLAATGTLRSGAASQGVQKAAQGFGAQVGRAASANALQAEELGLREREGEAGRGLEREKMASQERQFGQDIGLRREQFTEGQRQFNTEQG